MSSIELMGEKQKRLFVSLGFDIHGLDQNAKEDQEGIEKASKLCKRLFRHGIDLQILIVSE